MTFSESVKSCYSKFVTWQGRASRSEYWFFFLFSMICQIGAMVVDNILGTSFTIEDPSTGQMISIGYGYIYVLVALVNFLPHLAVLVRRLHDTDRSGWWYWIALIPLVGAILLIVWLATRGTQGSNSYGSDPLGADLGQTFN